MFKVGEKMPEVHQWCKDTVASLCDKIDVCGGWNPEAACVKFYHGDIRSLVFSKDYHNSEWWTVCLARDEYYWQRISERKKQEIIKKIKDELVNSLQGIA